MKHIREFFTFETEERRKFVEFCIVAIMVTILALALVIVLLWWFQ